jgi:hypothetical protein
MLSGRHGHFVVKTRFSLYFASGRTRAGLAGRAPRSTASPGSRRVLPGIFYDRSIPLVVIASTAPQAAALPILHRLACGRARSAA